MGALAGLVPAALAISLFSLMGLLSGRLESVAGAIGLAVAAVAIGWLVGPIARGSAQSDIAALISYAFLAGATYLLVATVISLSTFVPGGDARTPWDWIADALARFGYGLLYVPFWAAFVSPFALAWVGTLRWLRRRRGEPQASARAAAAIPDPSEAARSRRLVSIAAIGIVAYGAFVAVLPLLLYVAPRPPWWLERPLALFGLFAVPAVIAIIGLSRDAKPLVMAAGAICLLQSYIAFSGVTIGFIVPGLVLVAKGASGIRSDTDPPGRRAVLAGTLAVVLAISAWIGLFALTAPRCWTGVVSAGGDTTTVEVPATEQQLHGPMIVPAGGAGCSSAELTPTGLAVSAVLAIGAIAVAGYAPIVRAPASG